MFSGTYITIYYEYHYIILVIKQIFNTLFKKTKRYESMLVLTLLYSKSQHFTCLSSPQENKYGCLVLTTRPRTVLICPVNDSFKRPLAKSQI